MDKAKVEYRSIEGFPGYAVSADGSVWTCWKRTAIQGEGGRILRVAYKMTPDWKRLKLHPTSNGYASVCLCRNGKKKTIPVHKLVLEAFVGPCPKGMEACHAPDHNKMNCRLSNVRWGTPLDNAKDRRQQGRQPCGETCHMSKLTARQVRRIRKLYVAGFSHAQLGRKFNVTAVNIGEIVRRKTWRHI